MAKKYDIKIRTGEYEQDGETKGRYVRAGVIFETKNGGLMGKLEVVPIKDWDGTFFLSEVDESSYQSQEVPRQSSDSNETLLRDIPF